jgi:aspartyl-tRNA(Asn)/glutamyl-tRNA(Gln) amidotransferase subunit B
MIMANALEQYEAVIGLEIHVQLATKSKMFCRCDNNSEGTEPNINVCPVCMGYPGTLPVINSQAIDWGIKTALALGCSINPLQRFDRKNYFYPDLPKGYQISQFFYPVGEKGDLAVDYLDGDRKTRREFAVGITRLHLEEDAGKLLHTESGTLVDLNRCGTPLMEVVTEPDIKTPLEAKAFMQELQRVVRALGVSSADMEKGHLRVDANVSVRPIGQDALGAKVEVKNMNSFRFMESALKFEIERQMGILERGETIEQETRGWDEKTGTTISQRSKEGSVDYRYFPEPDLPPIIVEKEKIDELTRELPDLPARWRLRAEELGLPYNRVAEVQDKGQLVLLVRTLEQAQAGGVRIDPVLAANFVDRFNNESKLLEFLDVIARKHLSASAAQKYLATGQVPTSADPNEIERVVRAVLADNAEVVGRFKAGDSKVLGYLMGQVMAKSGGEAEPALVKDILERLLTE